MKSKRIIHEKDDILQNRYKITGVLGEGGFGVTYKALDTFMDVPVAIKEYNNKNISGYDEAVKEAKIAAGFYELDCIASARDFFTENDFAYIVMEYVSGISIKRYIKDNGPLPGEVVLLKVKPLIESLIKIHETGVIHRDISGDNLMITKNKKLVLIDFGAARFMKEYENRDYTVIVKRGFSPIEQCRTNGKQGPYTDVYSLCATMYYMTTGIIPDDCVERVVKDKLKSLNIIEDTGLKADESDAIMKGLAVWPDDRYQTMSELYKALYVSEDRADDNIAIPDEYGQNSFFPHTRTGSTLSMYNAVKSFYNSRLYYKKKVYITIILLVMTIAAGLIIGQGLWKGNANTAQITVSGNETGAIAKPILEPTYNQVSPEITALPEITATPESAVRSEPTAAPQKTDKPKTYNKSGKNNKAKKTAGPKVTNVPSATDKPKDNNKDQKAGDNFFSGDLDSFMR